MTVMLKLTKPQYSAICYINVYLVGEFRIFASLCFVHKFRYIFMCLTAQCTFINVFEILCGYSTSHRFIIIDN